MLLSFFIAIENDSESKSKNVEGTTRRSRLEPGAQYDLETISSIWRYDNLSNLEISLFIYSSIFKHPLVTSIRILLKFHVRKTWILAKQTHNSFSLNFSNKGNFQREYDPLVPSSPSTVLNLLLPFLPSSYTISQAISPHYSPLQDNNIPVRWIHKNSRALRRALQRF